jgi:ribose transport system permease protein
VLGALLMQVVRTGMVLLGFPTYLQVGAIGVMIMLVVLIDNFRRRRLSR